MPLDKECDKAASILRAFTRDGFQVKSKDKAASTSSTGNPNNMKSVYKVPPRVLREAKGFVIYTVFRTGFQISGAAGSGILIARQRAAFGPPSGILLHTLGVGFLIGLDIYDTLLVLRTQEAVNAFTRPKLSLGAELSVAAGPLGSGVAVDMGITDRAPAWVYTKSKGFYAGVQVDGTVVIERNDENERVYGRKVGVGELIRGEVERVGGRGPGERRLVAAIEVAEGRYTTGAVVPRPFSVQVTDTKGEVEVEEEEEVDGEKEKYGYGGATPPLPPRGSPAVASTSRVQVEEFRVASGSSTPALPPRRYQSSSYGQEKSSSVGPGDDDKTQQGELEESYEDAPPGYDHDHDYEGKRGIEKQQFV